MLRRLALATVLASSGAQAAPLIVTDIPPVHSLVAQVAGERAEVALLAGGMKSAHHGSLTPSDARLLERAAVVIRAGHDIAPWLNRGVPSLAPGAEEVMLTAEGEDPHAWLAPAAAAAWVDRIEAALAGADPEGSEGYAERAMGLRERLAATQERMRERLAPVGDVPFVVQHDAYDWLREAFPLNQVGSIAEHEHDAPGAAHLREVTELAKQEGAACVFTEPGESDRLARVVAEAAGAKVAMLDVLGTRIEPGPGHHAALLDALTDDLVGCLGG